MPESSLLKTIQAELLKTYPCPHDNADTHLGDGRTWARCEDCGVTFRQENWGRYRKAAEDHEAALASLRELEMQDIRSSGEPIRQVRSGLITHKEIQEALGRVVQEIRLPHRRY